MRPSSWIISFVAKALWGASPIWQGCPPDAKSRIYFANHSSHLDALVIWSAMPYEIRKRIHPVAAKDYWDADPIRRYVATKTLRAVLINRLKTECFSDPLAPMQSVLDSGESLIVFPEGTRNTDGIGDFKPGLYHLAKRNPDVELIPSYLDNSGRCLPKGAVVPLPLICSVRFGKPIRLEEEEGKTDFLKKAKSSISELAQ